MTSEECYRLVSQDYRNFNKQVLKKNEHSRGFEFASKAIDFPMRLRLSHDSYLIPRYFSCQTHVLIRLLSKVALRLISLGGVIGELDVLVRAQAMSGPADQYFFKALRQRRISSAGSAFKPAGLNIVRYCLRGAWIFDLINASLDSRSYLGERINSVDDLDEFLLDKSALEHLDCLGRKDVARVEGLFRALGLKSILVHTDQSVLGVVLALAAKNLKIRSGVLAHGYFKNLQMVSVLPLHMDAIFVWSQDTADLIGACSGNDSKTKVFTLAGVKKGIVKRRRQQEKILVVGTPLNSYKNVSDSEFVTTLNRIFLPLVHSGVCVVYAFHPLSGRDYEVLQSLPWLKFARKDVYFEASNAKVVVGGNSSFLFEAAESGVQAIQMTELCTGSICQEMRGVDVVRGEELGDFYRSMSSEAHRAKVDSAPKFGPLLDFLECGKLGG